MARYFRFPFANQGDKVVFPDTIQADGSLSYNQGYGPDYQRNPATDNQARRPDRSRFNQLLFDITSTLQRYYQEDTPRFITASDNGGTAFQYPIYARVRYDDGSGFRVYESLKNNNNSLPTVTADWRLVDIAGLDARFLTRALADSLYITTAVADGRYLTPSAGDSRFLNESNNLSDLENAATARTNLGLVTGTAAGNIPVIGTPGTTAAGANSAVVVRSGMNANGRFRVWSDGFTECYGVVINPGSGETSVTHNLPVNIGTIISPLAVSYPTVSTIDNDWWIQVAGFTSTTITVRYQSVGDAPNNRRFAFVVYGQS